MEKSKLVIVKNPTPKSDHQTNSQEDPKQHQGEIGKQLQNIGDMQNKKQHEKPQKSSLLEKIRTKR